MEKTTKPGLPDKSNLLTLTVILDKNNLNITELSSNLTFETSKPNDLKLLKNFQYRITIKNY